MQPSTEQTTIKAADGREIRVRSWSPGRPAGAIQVLHGMGEHSARYERFAHAAVRRGFSIVVHDHRGHGEHAGVQGHFGDADGWQLALDDIDRVRDSIARDFPGLPVVLLGHSMGSFLAQHHAMRHGDGLAGLVLSGSTWPQRLTLLPGLLLARLELLRLGPRGNSALLDRLGFGAFNRRFEPARTEYDWLSRDAAEVDRYVADPLCGGPFSCALWRDLLGGLWGLGSAAALRRIPTGLPILITGGTDDPVGGERSLRRLARAYEQSGHSAVEIRLYAGGRHEMLNETNRDAVTGDWLAWIDATMRNSRAG